jgi:cytochrome c553
MKAALRLLPVVSLLCIGVPAAAQDQPPPWAYPVNPPDFKPPPDDGSARHVPNSSVALTLTQTRDLFFAPDWHPAEHAALPEIVAQGRKPDVYACGFCHRADGPGGPENANLMGLPASYIKRQVADFRSGKRKSSVMNRAPMSLKVKLATAVTDEEAAAAAAYFASQKPRTVIRVRETDTVPKTVVAAWFLVKDPAGGMEPIGDRIIEIADDLDRFVSRDTHVTFTASVPVGSVQKGRELASGKGDPGAACDNCHGAGLKGAEDVPGIAGRSPTYIFRQLYDFQHKVRAGPDSVSMMPSVEMLSQSDMVALAAYAASLAP